MARDAQRRGTRRGAGSAKARDAQRRGTRARRGGNNARTNARGRGRSRPRNIPRHRTSGSRGAIFARGVCHAHSTIYHPYYYWLISTRPPLPGRRGEVGGPPCEAALARATECWARGFWLVAILLYLAPVLQAPRLTVRRVVSLRLQIALGRPQGGLAADGSSDCSCWPARRHAERC